jgi:nicotinate-nucleotide--dimethylbenzimidazole phosphoribosyltransferase
MIRTLLEEQVARIAAPDMEWGRAAREHLNSLTKPLGSLGQLETIAEQLVLIFKGRLPEHFSKAAYVFAADHGIVAEGVSLYPAEVTAQMVHNFSQGGAAINVLCRKHTCALTVADIGVNADLTSLPNVEHRKVRMGSRNFAREAAMTEEEFAAALRAGIELADDARRAGKNLIAVGEMGIGNTTSASAIAAMLTKNSAEVVTGLGTGLDESARKRKAAVIESALQLHFGQDRSASAVDVLRCVGGLEIAAMTGFYLACAGHGIALVCDGFISTAAAALAAGIAPGIRAYLFAGHCSQEPGHRYLLAWLGLEPILLLQMRLGEGSGAVLAVPVIESAAAIYSEMATFASAGVSEAQ